MNSACARDSPRHIPRTTVILQNSRHDKKSKYQYPRPNHVHTHDCITVFCMTLTRSLCRPSGTGKHSVGIWGWYCAATHVPVCVLFLQYIVGCFRKLHRHGGFCGTISLLLYATAVVREDGMDAKRCRCPPE